MAHFASPFVGQFTAVAPLPFAQLHWFCWQLLSEVCKKYPALHEVHTAVLSVGHCAPVAALPFAQVHWLSAHVLSSD